jgi:hypothetical protein
VDAHAGQPLQVEVALAPIRPPVAVAAVAVTAPPPRRGFWTGRRVAAVVAGGVAIGAGAAGIVLGVQARQLDRETYDLCPSPETACAEATAANDHNDQARTRALEANAAFGVAGAATIAAAILWYTGRPAAVAVTPTSGTGAVVGLAGAF